MTRLFTLTFLFLLSCTFSIEDSATTEKSTISIKYDREIDSGIRKNIESSNNVLISALHENDWLSVRSMCSEENQAQQNLEEFQIFIGQMSGVLESTECEIYDEFQVSTEEPMLEIIIDSKEYVDRGMNNYTITYGSLSKDSYVSLLSSKGLDRDMLITVVYGKYESEWKIDQLYGGEYRIKGFTAPELYTEAEEAYINDELLKSYTLLYMSRLSYQPGNVVFKYEIEYDMEDFYDQLFEEVKTELQLPMVINDVSNSPEIYDLQIVHTTDKEYLPLVTYITHLNFEDQKLVEKECDQINRDLEKVLPGFAWEFPKVIFQVLDNNPDLTEDEVHMGIFTLDVFKS